MTQVNNFEVYIYLGYIVPDTSTTTTTTPLPTTSTTTTQQPTTTTSSSTTTVAPTTTTSTTTTQPTTTTTSTSTAPTFTNTITVTNTVNGNASDGITFLASAGDQLSYNAIATGTSGPASITLAIGDPSNVVGTVSYLDRYNGQRFSFKLASTGVTYSGSGNVFTNGATIILI